MTTADDETWMRRAIALAQANLRLTADNPSVGCVIVRHGAIVGEAATAPGGRPHAEEQALDQAGEAARDAVAYVTLEPCGARSAGHASCAERLVAAGVAKVFAATADASPFASGRGVARLHAAQVGYELGLLRAEAEPLYVDRPPFERPTSVG